MQEDNHLRAPVAEITFRTTENTFTLKHTLGKGAYTAQETKNATGTTDANISNALISFATQNDTNADSATFSLVLAGTVRWDERLQPNDVVNIKVHNSVSDTSNPVIMVGLISEVKEIATFSEDSIVYQINGLSMMKAIMQQKLGTLQEISGVLSAQTGWFTTILNNGVVFNGKKASEVIKQVIDYFAFTYTDYKVGTEKVALKDLIEYDLKSHEDEYLTDATPYVSFEGSLRQLISDAQAKPFNEFYHDFTPKGTCKLYMRPTPFEKPNWEVLDTYKINAKNIIEKNLMRTDAEAYSIFSVSIPSNVIFSGTTLGNKPQYAEELTGKYGYSMLQVENRYIFQTKDATTETGTSDSSITTDYASISSADVDQIRKATLAWTDRQGVTAENLKKYIGTVRKDSPFYKHPEYLIKAGEKSGLNPVYILAHASIESAWGTSAYARAGNFFGIGAFDTNPDNAYKYGNSDMASGLINGAVWIRKNFFDVGQETLYTMRHNKGSHEYATDPVWDKSIATLMAQYYSLFPPSKDSGKATRATAKETTEEEVDENAPVSEDDIQQDVADGNKERLGKYSKYLFNWYADNPSYYAGDFRVMGNPEYRVGGRLQWYDEITDNAWEYYIESVAHDFSFDAGYSTILGVTRGLPMSKDRFEHHYKSKDFTGGLFGEADINELYASVGKGKPEDEPGGEPNPGGELGGSINGDGASIIALCKKYITRTTKYLFGGGHKSDPFDTPNLVTIELDCSSLTGWVYYHAGVKGWDKSDAISTTWGQVTTSKLTTVAELDGGSTSTASAKNSTLGKASLGDLLFFDTGGENTHVGIYAGKDDKGVHYFYGSNGNGNASDTTTNSGIQLKPITSAYWMGVYNGTVRRPRNK